MKRFLLAGACAALTLMSCGDDSADVGSTSLIPPATETVPATDVAQTTDPAAPTTQAAGSVALRVISLSPTATEMLFAIGAGDQVVAVSDYSNYPAEALDKPHELSGFEPSIEAIAAYQPDLVVHDGSIEVTAQLAAVGIADWIGPVAVTLDDVYTQLEQLGALTGHVGEAAELVGQMQTEIAAILADAPPFAEPLTFFHELDNTLYSVTSATFIGGVYNLFGLQNIADTAESASSYPQLSAEFVISQNPDLIFLADGSFGESPETVAARPGWSEITAVKLDTVIAVDEDVASRWGPRIVDYIRFIAESLAKVPAPV